MGGLDVERAAANGATAGHRKALVWQWRQITRLLGVDTEPKAITFEAVQNYVMHRREEGALGQTIAREVSALKRACDEAHRRGWLLWTPERWPTVKRDPPGDKRTGKFHPPHILSMWMGFLPQDARDTAEIACLTSLRDAELGRITSAWIEPTPTGSSVSALLRVPGRSAKGRKEKLIPLVPRVVDILSRRMGTIADGLPLFPGSHKRAFATARRKLGYIPTISLRDLRHTWATLAATIGVDAARSILGHANLATTSRYVHADLERGAQAALAIEGMIGTVQSAQVAEMERATRLELATLSLGSQDLSLPKILEHVTTCKICQQRAVAHAKMHVIASATGTPEPSHLLASKGGRG